MKCNITLELGAISLDKVIREGVLLDDPEYPA
jgi:hypothetical protein